LVSTGATCHLFSRRFVVGQDPLAAFFELDACIGRDDAPGGAAEQADAEVGLDLRDPAADDGLRDSQPLGGAIKATAFNDLDEEPEIFQIAHVFLS
jgi:hypothetical protein